MNTLLISDALVSSTIPLGAGNSLITVHGGFEPESLMSLPPIDAVVFERPKATLSLSQLDAVEASMRPYLKEEALAA